MSSNKRLLVFANDPASARVTLAYAYIYQNLYDEILLFPYDKIAETIYAEYMPSSISSIDKKPLFKADDTVITGTSGLNPNYEIETIIDAHKANVSKIITIVDNPIHFNMRFSYKKTIIPKKYVPHEIWIFQDNYKSTIDYLNKNIIYKKDIYTKFLQTIYKNSAPKITHPFIKKYKNKYLVILTEYIYDFYGLKYGFTEYEMLENILECIEKSNLKIPIFLKLHPKEHTKKFNILLRKYSSLNIIKENCNIEELIYHSKVIFGINSSVFKESLLFNKPTYSIQIDASSLNKPDILDNNYIVTTRQELTNTIKKYFSL